MPTKRRKSVTKRNTTRSKSRNTLTDEQKKIVCTNYFNAHQSFEKDLEKKLMKKGINIFSGKYKLEDNIIKQLKTAVSPSNINPKTDYYTYINERWLKDYKIDESQKYLVQVDDFRIVQDKVYKQLLDIVEEYTATDKSPQSKCMKNFYESMKKLNTDEQSRNHAKIVLKLIDDLRGVKSNLWALLGFVNTNEIVSWGSPFVWNLLVDEKDPGTYRCFIDPPQVTLIDSTVYYDDGTDVEYKRKYKTRYLEFLSDLFHATFGKDHGFVVEDVFNVERKMLDAMDSAELDEDPDWRNVLTTKDALTKYGFDWDQFAKVIGFSKTPNFFITSSLNYLAAATQLLSKEWDTPEWRTYWIYIFIRQQQRFCVEGHKVSFEFHGKFVAGQEHEVGRELFPIYGLGCAFNTFLTNEYIARYENKQHVEYVHTMAEDLKTVFIRIIKRNKWMQPKTKAMALKKLNNFKLDVGSPKLLREDPILDYTDNDAWGNMSKIAKWRCDRAVKLEGKKTIDIPVMDWAQSPPKFVGSQAYVVNAMYDPTVNGIYIPLGYVQKPFIDLEERGIEYNLAHIGYTIAHEMSHSLDDMGSKYDHTGKLIDWWTPEDKRKFKRIQDDVIKQYEHFAKYDGIEFDAAPSIGEDIADISGLAMCLEYLSDFQTKNEDILPIQTLSFEAFFVYFALQQRQQISKKAIAAQLKTNPHPLDKYRTNVPLSRLKVFRAMYNIKKGDKMWWPSTNRVWEE
jgi:putative endopeptidase